MMRLSVITKLCISFIIFKMFVIFTCQDCLINILAILTNIYYLHVRILIFILIDIDLVVFL